MGLLPAAALAAENVDYIYYEWNETTQTLSEPKSDNVTSATEVTTNTTTWNSGWYVAQGEVTISSRVTVNGDVRLILADGCTLTVNGGIRVASGDRLTIYGQSRAPVHSLPRTTPPAVQGSAAPAAPRAARSPSTAAR